MRSLRLCFRFAFFCLPILPLVNCSSTNKNASSELRASNPVNYDFCSLRGVNPDPAAPELWSAESVAYHIDDLKKNPKVVGTPWAAYPTAYRKMTAARDKARCEGTMRGQNEVSARINHMLSDIMSRWYVSTVQQCVAADAKLGNTAGLCPLMRRIQEQRYDTVSAALASTAVYISSHISLSLAAIVFNDDFWEVVPNENTHLLASRPYKETLEARLLVMKAYKPLFDRFNVFLADNLGLVSSSLQEAKLLNGDSLNLATGLARIIPFKSLAFGKIRDQAFEESFKIARSLKADEHPMIKIVDGVAKLDYGNFNYDFVYTDGLRKIENDALSTLASPAMMAVYKGLLGGKTWEQMQKDLKIEP